VHRLPLASGAVSTATWETRVYPQFDGLAAAELSRFYLGVLPSGPWTEEKEKGGATTAPHSPSPVPVPAAFDWRDDGNLSTCIGPVQNQGKCGSCWAVSSAESLADRLCIRERREQPANQTQPLARLALSSLDVIACDKLCDGIEKCCRGCTGGYPKLAFEFAQKTGLVSAACMPYNLTRSLLCPLPPCQPPISDRKHRARSVKLVYGGPAGMQKELLASGPVVATFRVYEDFMSYSSGVYRFNGTGSGKELGLHAVKVLGWGQAALPDGSAYSWWACQNSWGDAWGEHGSFRIAAGECGFEQSVFTATPCLDQEVCV
jgi:cathepsin B